MTNKPYTRSSTAQNLKDIPTRALASRVVESFIMCEGNLNAIAETVEVLIRELRDEPHPDEIEQQIGQRPLSAVRELACTLLWLRNHYDVALGDKRDPVLSKLHKDVIERVDFMLSKHGNPDIAESTQWREQFHGRASGVAT